MISFQLLKVIFLVTSTSSPLEHYPEAKPDQSIAEPAFGILSDYANVRDLTMSAKGDEAYFSIQSPLQEISAIACIRKWHNSWTEPKLVSFTGQYMDLEPFLSPNGLRLYFASNRPLESASGESKDFDIWYVERESQGSNWSEPINMGSPINSDRDEFYPAITSSNKLYFTSPVPDSPNNDDIFVSVWTEDGYTSPVALSKSINTQGYEFNAYIAPDESFVIFSGYNRQDGFGSGDLYISFLENGEWSQAVNMGQKINSEYMDYCPFLDIQSNTLYFTSRRSNLNISIKYNNLHELREEISKYENGLSRIYKITLGSPLLTLYKR